MKRRLTPSEFDQAVKRLPRAMKARNIQIARAILVEGRKQAELVRETGLSRTAIAAVVRKIREAHETYGQPPEGWERIEVCLPSEMVHLVRALEEEARRQHENED
ncbi:TPA: TrfB-related DNA-binding protein [Escherichia coli]|nr:MULTISPECIES: TrfB-related DNA-binding protein [Gammaproteobacteria]AOS36948.1 transcriptional regulator [Piscirickettsia salmonis]AUV50306.1 transcriptional regulator [Vibrio alginolyticus]EAY3929528.1 transcriptional regulator [Salmonella enterica]QOI95905.1 transcriptional regulator [Aeromonas salmonicida subsp. masoucida]HAM8461520.1 transcriptional regulator [Escherichia coli]